MVVVPLYDTLGAEAATFIVSQAEISVVIVDSYKKAECLVQNRHNMPSLKSVIVIDSAELLNGPVGVLLFFMLTSFWQPRSTKTCQEKFGGAQP